MTIISNDAIYARASARFACHVPHAHQGGGPRHTSPMPHANAGRRPRRIHPERFALPYRKGCTESTHAWCMVFVYMTKPNVVSPYDQVTYPRVPLSSFRQRAIHLCPGKVLASMSMNQYPQQPARPPARAYRVHQDLNWHSCISSEAVTHTVRSHTRTSLIDELSQKEPTRMHGASERVQHSSMPY